MSAGKPFFLDTNVLLYWLDQRNPDKQRSARKWVLALWEEGAGRISWQVINEFYTNAVGKLGASAAEARAMVEVFAKLEPCGYSLALLRRAWHWVDKTGVPYWDGLILASAETTGCSYLLTEDFQTGRRFGDVTVINPFRKSPAEFGLTCAE